METDRELLARVMKDFGLEEYATRAAITEIPRTSAVMRNVGDKMVMDLQQVMQIVIDLQEWEVAPGPLGEIMQKVSTAINRRRAP